MNAQFAGKLAITKHLIRFVPGSIATNSYDLVELGGCGLRALPPEFQQLTQLETCRLSDNCLVRLQNLPAGIKVLDLDGNRITDRAPWNHYTKLTTLHLSRNPLTSIAPLLVLTQLTDLNLSDTFVSSLEGIKQLTKLYILRLERMTPSLETKDFQMLLLLSGLCYVSLSGNKIVDISGISAWTRLTSLELCGNVVSLLPAVCEEFRTLTELQVLDLKENGLTPSEENNIKEALSPEVQLTL